MKKSAAVLATLAFQTIVTTAHAGEADVLKVDVTKTANGTYSFSVTLKHADTGWSHYADKWDVVTMDGKVLGTRVLYHPHVNEQPFTRSLSDVKIPNGTTQIVVRAHDKVDGYGGVEKTVKLPK